MATSCWRGSEPDDCLGQRAECLSSLSLRRRNWRIPRERLVFSLSAAGEARQVVLIHPRLSQTSKGRWLSQTDAQKAWLGVGESWWVELMGGAGEELEQSPYVSPEGEEDLLCPGM